MNQNNNNETYNITLNTNNILLTVNPFNDKSKKSKDQEQTPEQSRSYLRPGELTATFDKSKGSSVFKDHSSISF